LKKAYSIVALILIAGTIVFALASFVRENWGADQTPGPVETFLARWLLTRPGGPEAEEPNPIPLNETTLQEGRALYEKYCAFCHGLEGRGTGEKGIQFYPPVPSLAEPAADLTEGRIYYIVARGIRYTAMPSFAKALAPEEIWKIVHWVQQLARKNSP
jgi:mono/diheme cytochrome c family protein